MNSGLSTAALQDECDEFGRVVAGGAELPPLGVQSKDDAFAEAIAALTVQATECVNALGADPDVVLSDGDFDALERRFNAAQKRADAAFDRFDGVGATPSRSPTITT